MFVHATRNSADLKITVLSRASGQNRDVSDLLFFRSLTVGGSDPRSPSAAVTASSSHKSGSGEKEALTPEELRRRRQAYFDR